MPALGYLLCGKCTCQQPRSISSAYLVSHRVASALLIKLACLSHLASELTRWCCADSYSERVSVAKVQVGLLGTARGMQRDLERIADRADTDSPSGLHYVLQGECCSTRTSLC